MTVYKYSLLIYCKEFLKESIETVLEALKNGVVVHLFFEWDFKAELQLRNFNCEIFNLAIENKLLFVYENQEEIWHENTIIGYDNNICVSELYNKICDDENSEFNGHQYNIIAADEDSNYIVISGAGTGKTTTMINRLIYLRKTSTSFTFDKAALITFTNKSTREMRERLIAVLERYYVVTKDPKYLDMMDEATKCNISTIHGFSKKLINQYGKAINLNKDIQIKSFRYYRKKAIAEGLEYLYKNHRETYDLIKYYPLYDVEAKLLSFWEKLDNFSIDVTSESYKVDFGEDEKSFPLLVEIVIKKAQEYLESNKEYEFEIADLMKKLAYKELFYAAKGRYELIMVDEFQDSDNIQIDFVSNFCSITGAKLLVVGDEKQSIYRFRGAEHTSFYRLSEALKEKNMTYKEFTMVRNYRTDSSLLKEINQIFINIDRNVERFNYKEQDYIYSLVNKESDSKIEYVSLNEDLEESGEFYSELLVNKNEDEYVAVLLRSNNDIREFKEFCDRKSIPCRVDVSGEFFRHEAVRDFYIMIKALIDTSSNSVMYSFINTPYINRTLNKEKILIENNVQVAEYFNDILLEKTWDEYQVLVKEKNVLELIDIIIGKFNPVKQYYSKEFLKAKRNNRDPKKVAYVKALEYKLNLEHLLYIIKEKFSDNVSSVFTIEEFLKLKISTDNTVDARRPHYSYEKDFLQCSTVHKAKGLEYDYVVMPKLTNLFITMKAVDVILRNKGEKIDIGFKFRLGDNEYKNSYYGDYLRDEKDEIIGEEARLLYVAMTRCKRKLYLNATGVIATEATNNWKSLIGGARSYV